MTKSRHPVQYYDLARQSCADLILDSTVDLPATIDPEKIDSFADTALDATVVRDKGSSLAQDANFTRVDAIFESVEAEAGLIVLMHALDFGGGWRLALHSHTGGKGAWLTVKAGVERLYDENPKLQAQWLASRTESQVAELFRLPNDKDSELRPFVSLLTQVMNEVGVGIQKSGIASTVSEWLLIQLEKVNESQTPAGALVQALVETFPYTFNDCHFLTDASAQVFLYKKAQLVVGELYHRFRGMDARFDFVDGDSLTAFIDNVICAVCRKLGLITVSNELTNKIESDVLLPSGSLEEVSLRAASMVAIERIVARKKLDGLTSVELGNYFWGYLGKTEEFRKFARHATRDTVFY